ncbi:helix-turn-helix domain-containing protein [Kineococcus sp. R8]|uniref:nucleotidyltransferase domain-containing protein n=1 Tax=Kineococcus siccus TaxID=2696567 RepID=UPI001411BA8E|nr:helix-turn-helix domain-containing protein [Kineococcus siccus]
MDPVNPLRTIAPTVDADVLQVLARTQRGLNGSMVARLSGRSYAQVRTSLHRLVSHGLVTTQDAGSAVLYRLNRSHVLSGPVLAVVAATGTVEAWLGDRLGRWSPPPVAVVLFGSWARGAAAPDSDLDLLVVRADDVDADGPWGEQLHATGEELEALTGNPVQFVQVTTAQLATAVREAQPLITGLRQDGRVLVGPSLRALLAAGGPA